MRPWPGGLFYLDEIYYEEKTSDAYDLQRIERMS